MDDSQLSGVQIEQLNSILGELESETFGDFIKRKCSERDISVRQLASMLDMSLTPLQHILNGKTQKIDAKILLKFSEFFGIDTRVLLNAYMASVSEEESKAINRARKAGFLTQHFDLKELKKIGFIKNDKDYDAIEKRVIEFFGFEKLAQYASLHSTPLFSRTQRRTSDKMLTFWLMVVHDRMRTVKNPFPFDPVRLEKIIPFFRRATMDVKKGFKGVLNALYECGITVIIESYLTKTQIRGGTFLYNGKPYIFLTRYPNNYDTLWFALLHEIGHVMFDLDFIRDRNMSHLSGEGGLFEDPLIEKGADDFAMEILLSSKNLEYAERIIHIDGFVKKAAEDWGIHPSIIYGQYCYKHNNPINYMKYGRYRIKADEAIKFDYITWEKPTLQETAPLIENQLVAVS